MAKRPGVDGFLRKTSEVYELVVYTASMSKYANALLDKIDPCKFITHRLFREHCTFTSGGFVKDLSKLGRRLKDVLILDNSPCAYSFQPSNAIPVKSWFDDVRDTQLPDLLPLLKLLSRVDDVREYLTRLTSTTSSVCASDFKAQTSGGSEQRAALVNCWVPQQGRTGSLANAQQAQVVKVRHARSEYVKGGVASGRGKNCGGVEERCADKGCVMNKQKGVLENKRAVHEYSNSKVYKAKHPLIEPETAGGKYYQRDLPTRGNSVQTTREIKKHNQHEFTKESSQNFHQNTFEKRQWTSGSLRPSNSCRSSMQLGKETPNAQHTRKATVEMSQSKHKEPASALRKASASKCNEQKLRSSLTISTGKLNTFDKAGNGLSTTKGEKRVVQFHYYKMKELMGTVIPRNHPSHRMASMYQGYGGWTRRYDY